MAAPIDSSLTLPDDSGNAGKKFRTETRVVGGNTVHENFIIPVQAMTITGKYFFSSTQQSVLASAQNGTSTGFFWLQNPIASTITAQIKYVDMDVNTSSTVVAPTAPTIAVTKFTFTGTASGATVAALPAQTVMPTNQMIVRTAVTGMTVSLVADVCAMSIPSVLTGVGQCFGAEILYKDNPTSYVRGLDLEIAPGEGLVIWQEVAGTTSDPRRFGLQMDWVELDLS